MPRDRRNPLGFEIYRHVCQPTGKCYIGITEYGANRRWVQHVRAAVLGSELFIHRAIRKYGVDAFSHEVLEVVRTREEANAAENRWIAHYRADQMAFGYNLDAGGRSHNTHPETRRKIGAAHSARLAKLPTAERIEIATRASAALSREERRALTLKQWDDCSSEDKAAQVNRLQASRTTEQRSEETQRQRAVESPEQKATRERKRKVSLTPEKRRAAAMKRNNTLGAVGLREVANKISAAWHCKTPEQQKELVDRRKLVTTPESRRAAAIKAAAAQTPEARSERARRMNASFTPEQRSEIARKREAVKREQRLSAKA